MSKPVLLKIKEPYFSQILTGEKKEEIRNFSEFYINKFEKLVGYNLDDSFKFCVLRLENGYAKDAPFVVIECPAIEIETSAEEGEDLTEENTVFVLILGKILETGNLKQKQYFEKKGLASV